MPTPRIVEVSEYGQVVLDLTERQARTLQAVAGPHLAVVPANTGYKVRATSFVGSIAIPGWVLHVVPKVSTVANVLELMTWSTHRLLLHEDDVGLRSSSLAAAVAALYSRTLDRTLARGVDHAYVEEDDRLVTLRGRVDLPAQARAVGLAVPIACRYDEWSIDTASNRLVRAAALALLRMPDIAPSSGYALRRAIWRLDGVTQIRPGEGAAPTPLTRLNRHYAAAVDLARLVLRAAGPAQSHGSVGTASFMINMNDVFEDFVHGSLANALRGRLDVVRQRVVPLGARGEVRSEPDLIFVEPGGGDLLVADIKYKLTTDGRGRSQDYYQLLAYCTSLGLGRGVLIYCDAEGEQPPRSVRVRNQQTQLETYRLGIKGAPSEIRDEITRLAAHIHSVAAGIE